MGSVLLIEEDKHGRYADCLAKFFLAEGSVHRHALFLANLDVDPTDIVRENMLISFWTKFDSIKL